MSSDNYRLRTVQKAKTIKSFNVLGGVLTGTSTLGTNGNNCYCTFISESKRSTFVFVAHFLNLFVRSCKVRRME